MISLCSAHDLQKLGRQVAKPHFNQEGLAAIEPRHGGGPPIKYGLQERSRILAEFERQPDREQDGTATWSLNTLQRALRTSADGLPTVSTYAIWLTLHDAGWRWQGDRTWCKTGTVARKRKGQAVEVADPEAEAKKPDRAGLLWRRTLMCLEELLRDDDGRAALRARGLRRASAFSWEQSAEAALAPFEEMARR
jgi:hypothetical protein